MSHLDEGTLHALLDGELATTEVAEIQAHLGSCTACGHRLREVKEFLTEADRLIGSVALATPVAAGPRGAEVPADPPPVPAPAARQRPVPPPDERETWNEPPPPVMLVPDNELPSERRLRRLRRLGWAAMFLVIAGAGWVEVQKIRPTPHAPPPSSNTLAVVSPEETARDESPAPAASGTTSRSPVQDTVGRATRSQASKPSVTPQPAAPAGEKSRQVAANPEAAPPPVIRDGATADSLTARRAPASATTEGVEDLSNVRERAAQALADLDRQRRRDQAAAATAALDAERRREASRSTDAPAAAPAPPPPPTLEQRGRVYLRIGLDEASRQLGGPAHVIEGLSPLFMGLAQGSVVTGADATRPVVRVVYQDSQGRLIFLDQQRVRTGRAGPTPGPLAWTTGEVALWLNGEAGASVLRTYRPRVR